MPRNDALAPAFVGGNGIAVAICISLLMNGNGWGRVEDGEGGQRPGLRGENERDEEEDEAEEEFRG